MALPASRESEVVATIGEAELDRLLHFRSREALVLSLYVTFRQEQGLRGIKARLHSILKPIHELADSHELSHAARLSLRADLERIHEIAEPLDLAWKGEQKELDERSKRGRQEALPEKRRALLGRTVAIFACHHAGLYEQCELRQPVPDQVELDATPYLRPLLAVMDKAHDAVVAIIDIKNAWLFTYTGSELREAEKLHEALLDKRNRAAWHGLEERGMLNREQTLERKHLKETAERVEDLMLQSGAAVVVVGGHQETNPEFVALLSKSMRSKVAGQFVVDTSTMTPVVIRDQTRKILEAYEQDEELHLVAEVLERVTAGALGAAGLQWCLLAVNEKAVDLLLVQDEVRRPGRACDNCGWLGLAEVECPVCANPTREAADILDEMEAAVIVAGGRVKNVRRGTALDQHTVAARLRFPVPRPEAAEGGDR